MSAATLSWENLDWAVLDRMRDTFLAGRPGGASYWNSRSDVANYDFTFAQRIGWKWDAVLRELKLRGWTPPAGRPLLDWGCGSGIAGRRVVESFGEGAFRKVRLFDRSPIAVDYAVEVVRKDFPSLAVEAGDVARPDDLTSVGLLVLSHVINELDEAGGRVLREVIDRAESVLWVEPGTHADSRALIAVRESLRERFHLIAPCPHQAECGMRAPENGRHWCHHFAPPPPGLLADAGWVRFAQRAGIDLRSLPYSFLALERKGLREPVPGLLPEDWGRVIGVPRVYKGFAKVLSCRAAGLGELELQKRDAPQIFKAMKGDESPSLYRGRDNGRRIEPGAEWR